MGIAANGRAQYSKRYLEQSMNPLQGFTDAEWQEYLDSYGLNLVDPFVGTKPCWQGCLRRNVEALYE